MPTTDPNRQEDRDGNELIVLPGKRLLDVEAYIAGDPQSGIQDGVQQQIQSHEHNPPNEIGPNEEARLWEDLKAETGYSSYSDYLCASEERLSYSLEFAGYRLHTRGSTKAEYASCVILDFSNGDDSRPRLSLRCSSSSGSVVLAALRQPSAGVAVRTVLWKTSELDEVMVNAIGLGFKIHPRFFHVLFATSGRLSSWGKEERLDERPLVPNIVVIENHVVAMARCSPPVYPDATPVILIASHSFGALTGKAHFDEVSHFRSAIVETLSRPLEGTPEWSVEYIRILQYDLEKERGSIGSDTNLLLRPLIPLLYFNIFRIRGECGLVREKYYKFIVPHDKFIASLGGVESRFPLGNPKNADRTSLEDLYELRVVLRRKIEDSEDNSEQLRRFLRSQRMLDVRQGKLFTMVEDDLQQVRLDAHRLETEIRDYLQLQTGVMAIHESRKSIELSNIQIEEGKRGQSKCTE